MEHVRLTMLVYINFQQVRLLFRDLETIFSLASPSLYSIYVVAFFSELYSLVSRHCSPGFFSNQQLYYDEEFCVYLIFEDMERVFSFSALISVFMIVSSEVSGYPKLIHRSLEENVGITLNQITEPENVSKAIEFDELTIAHKILERVPLIDG